MKTLITLICVLSAMALSIISAPSAFAARGIYPTMLVTSLAAERIDAIVRQSVVTGHFSGVVLVRQGLRLLYSKAYGDTRVRHLPNTMTTRFALPGVSALFTLVAAQRLAERHQITPRVVFQPQIAWSAGWQRDAIGMIEWGSHLSYTAYLQRNILHPLGMTHTTVEQRRNTLPEISSTAGDLDRFGQAVVGCDLVSPLAFFDQFAPNHRSIQLSGSDNGASAGIRVGLDGTTIIVLANSGSGVTRLLSAIHSALSRS